MREKLFVSLLCLALVMALSPAGAQDEADGASQEAPQAAPASSGDGATPSAPASSQQSSGGGAAKSAPKSSIPGLPKIPGSIIGIVSHIGDLFGKATGMRIGGTSVSAIAMLVIAKLIQDKAPDWLRYVLYIGGGTMFAGSGANIVQSIMGNMTF